MRDRGSQELHDDFAIGEQGVGDSVRVDFGPFSLLADNIGKFLERMACPRMGQFRPTAEPLPFQQQVTSDRPLHICNNGHMILVDCRPEQRCFGRICADCYLAAVFASFEPEPRRERDRRTSGLKIEIQIERTCRTRFDLCPHDAPLWAAATLACLQFYRLAANQFGTIIRCGRHDRQFGETGNPLAKLVRTLNFGSRNGHKLGFRPSNCDDVQPTGGLFTGSVQIEDDLAGLNPKQMMAGAASLHREDVDMTRDHPKHLIAVIEKNGAPRVGSQAAPT